MPNETLGVRNEEGNAGNSVANSDMPPAVVASGVGLTLAPVTTSVEENVVATSVSDASASENSGVEIQNNNSTSSFPPTILTNLRKKFAPQVLSVTQSNKVRIPVPEIRDRQEMTAVAAEFFNKIIAALGGPGQAKNFTCSFDGIGNAELKAALIARAKDLGFQVPAMTQVQSVPSVQTGSLNAESPSISQESNIEVPVSVATSAFAPAGLNSEPGQNGASISDASANDAVRNLNGSSVAREDLASAALSDPVASSSSQRDNTAESTASVTNALANHTSSRATSAFRNTNVTSENNVVPTPTSATPTSATPTSATPTSATPTSATPTSATPAPAAPATKAKPFGFYDYSKKSSYSLHPEKRVGADSAASVTNNNQRIQQQIQGRFQRSQWISAGFGYTCGGRIHPKNIQVTGSEADGSDRKVIIPYAAKRNGGNLATEIKNSNITIDSQGKIKIDQQIYDKIYGKKEKRENGIMKTLLGEHYVSGVRGNVRTEEKNLARAIVAAHKLSQPMLSIVERLQGKTLAPLDLSQFNDPAMRRRVAAECRWATPKIPINYSNPRHQEYDTKKLTTFQHGFDMAFDKTCGALGRAFGIKPLGLVRASASQVSRGEKNEASDGKIMQVGQRLR